MDEKALRRLAGQVVVAGFNGTEINDHARTLVQDYHIGNIILFARNVSSMQQTAKLNADLQALAKESGQDAPLMICTDQENGIVRRIAPDLPGLPGNMAIGATFNPQTAREIGAATARQLLAAGINWNLAPVLDVNNNAKNPVIGVRSYGEDANVVAEFGSAMALGLQQEGVIACGKHFPGHGDTAVDSHLALPTILHHRDRLESLELVPFKAAIDAGIDSIMSAHVVFPAYEPNEVPATLSKNVLTGLLRDTLGFEGVITTDCMEMKAISDTVGTPNGAVQALLAGADIVMVSHTLDVQVATMERIVEAVLSGELPLQRLEEAALRVRRLKEKRLAATGVAVAVSDVIAEASTLQEQVCLSAATVVKNDANLLPLRKERVARVAVILDSAPPYMQAAGNFGSNSTLAVEVAHRFPNADVSVYQYGITEDFTWDDAALPRLDEYELVVAGVNGLSNKTFVEFVQSLAKRNASLVVMALQSPYDLGAFPAARTALAVYENTTWMVRAGVGALVGEGGTGRLPVTVDSALVRGCGGVHVGR